MEHFLTCHQNAFAAFGAVPARIMIDNLKSGVLKHAVGEAPVYNPPMVTIFSWISPCSLVRSISELPDRARLAD